MESASRARLQAHPFALPNLLTYARIAAVPAVVACMYWQALLGGGLWLRSTAVWRLRHDDAVMISDADVT